MKSPLCKIFIPVVISVYGAISLASLFIASAEAILWLIGISSAFFYLSIAILVYYERKRLAIYNIDRLSIVLLILGGSIIQRKLGIPIDNICLVVKLCASLTILICLILSWGKVPKVAVKWVLISIGATSILLVPLAFIQSISVAKWTGFLNNVPLLVIVRQMIYDLSYVSPVEEILFRGFLWGYFRQLGWSDNKTYWVQAIVFWLLHFLKIQNPVVFFISLPIGTMLLSMLTRFSKQTSPSIISHTMMNSISYTLGYLLFK